MSKVPYHQSPDGLMRACSNPPKCAFGTSVAEHETMTPKEAEKANEKITAEQMAAEGKGTTSTVSKNQKGDDSQAYKDYVQDIDTLLDDDTDMADSFDIAEAMYVHADGLSIDELDRLLKHYRKEAPEVDKDGEFFIKEVYETMSAYTESRRREEAPSKPDTEDDRQWTGEVSKEARDYLRGSSSGAAFLSSHEEIDEDGNATTVITANKADFAVAAEDGVVRAPGDFAVNTETDESAGKVVVSKKGSTFKAVFVPEHGEEEDLGGSRNPEALMKKAAKRLNPRSSGSKAFQAEDDKHAQAQKALKNYFAYNQKAEDKVKEINAQSGTPGELSVDQAYSILDDRSDNTEYGEFRREAAQHKVNAQNGNYSAQGIVAVDTTVSSDGLSYSSTYELADGGRELTENHSAEVSVEESGDHPLSGITSPVAIKSGKGLPEAARGITVPQKKVRVRESYELVDGNGSIVTTNKLGTAEFFAQESELVESSSALWKKDRALADESIGFLAKERAEVTRNTPEKGTAESRAQRMAPVSQGRETDELRNRLTDFVLSKPIESLPRPEGFRQNSAAANEERNRHESHARERNRVSDQAKELIGRIDALNNRPLPRF